MCPGFGSAYVVPMIRKSTLSFFILCGKRKPNNGIVDRVTETKIEEVCGSEFKLEFRTLGVQMMAFPFGTG